MSQHGVIDAAPDVSMVEGFALQPLEDDCGPHALRPYKN